MGRRVALNNKGFGAVEALIIVLVLVVIGGIGVFVFHYHQEHEKSVVTSHESSNTNISSSASSTSTTPADTAWAALSSDLQGAILAQWKVESPIYASNTAKYETDPMCHGGPQAQKTWVYGTQFANVVVGCDSPEQVMFAHVNGTWKVISSGQAGLFCSVLGQYKVPAKFVASLEGLTTPTCETTDSTVTYTH